MFSKIVVKKVLSLCLCVLFFLTSLGVPDAEALVESKQYPVNNIDLIINAVPKGDRWIQHLKEDLLPFWTPPTILEGINGNFATYRCNDGSLYNPSAPCTELADPVPGIVNLDREYVRSKSRQVFAYGIAYNLTGNSEYLQHAKDGVDFLKTYALDNSGLDGAYTYFDANDPTFAGKPGPENRVSQDMTYALSGLTFFYYLTRDPDVLQSIVNVKDYIFNTYYDKEWDLMAWVKQSFVDDGTEVSSEQRELVAQLDQVYAYMMLLTPILPTSFGIDGINLKEEWEKDLIHLATIMSEQFYAPDKNFFWGAITDSSQKKLGTDHTDFGHSIKTLWLIYEIGKLTGHYEFVLFTQEAAPKLLEAAYLEDGTWGRRINEYGQVERDKEWWILAELDQVAATFSLRDPSYAQYLPTTYAYWFEYMVDHEHKGIWHWVNGADNKPDIHFPKQHSWKNAFHSFEHAMVGYLTGQEIHDLDSELYFAFKNGQEIPDNIQIRPYTYAAKVKSVDPDVAGSIAGYGKQKVTFTDIR
ncbi:MAG: hypothetical protein QNJ36_20105 [Calothrix sp. MO_167.B42]|nr:hypothetical protein [Calothrix sp. MO_167.B42]